MKRLFLAALFSSLAFNLSVAATITVTNTNDSGPGSLRQAIADAAPGDTIDFALPMPAIINLTSDELLINKSLTIAGPGAEDLMIAGSGIDGSDFFRILEIGAGPFNVTLAGLTCSQGASYGDGGGALLNSSTGSVNITQCVFRDSSGNRGGGVNNNGTMALTSCSLLGNFVSGGEDGGGGIYNAGTMTVTDCTIADNNDEGLAGGPPLIEGAGIRNVGALTVTNCTIAGNTTSKGYGGAIANLRGTLTVTNCTIAGNISCNGGGGIFIPAGNNAANVQFKNCVIAQNYDGNGPPLGNESDIDGPITSGGYNLIGSKGSGRFTSGTGDQVGTAASPIDPMLGPLQNNGGVTSTRAPLPGSPLIDKGKSFGLTTDQRGFFRPVDAPLIPPAEGGDNSDIGAVEVQAGQALNISTRAQVLTGDKILDAGFVISGSEAKQLLIRGLGPSLGAENVPGILSDPVLQLYDGARTLLQTNDNWKDTQQAAIEATGVAPKDDAESAILVTLEPGNYTAILSGKSGGTGVGLVEVYDLDATPISTLANISTRGFVGTDANVMIGGFILDYGGGVRNRVLVRGLGPSLQAAGVSDTLPNPALELHDANGDLIAFNDNWQDTQGPAIAATGLAPTNAKEAAILQTLPAGSYTAIVSGVDQMTGVALLEVYDLN